MPSLPTVEDVHVDQFLSEVLIAYVQEQTRFVAGRVFPAVNVIDQTGIFLKYDKSDWLRSEVLVRAPASESQGSGFRTDKTGTFFAAQRSVHMDIDPQMRANQQSPIDLDSHAARWVAQQLLIDRDQLWVDGFFKLGIWSKDRTGVSGVPTGDQFQQWNEAGSTPIDDITEEVERVESTTGFRPNRVVLGAKVFNVLRNHPDVQDRIKFSERGVVTTDLLEALFDVEQVVVPRAVQDTGPEGGTSVFDYIVGKAALVVYAAESPAILAPSGGYAFSWTGLLGAGAFAGRIKRLDMPLRNSSTRVEGDFALDMKLVANDLGTFFSAAIA